MTEKLIFAQTFEGLLRSLTGKLTPRLATGLRERGWAVERVLLPQGEAAKRLGVVESAASALAGLRVERSEPLVAIGGGALGDTVGFLAATYLRGIPFIQVPTTLVAGFLFKPLWLVSVALLLLYLAGILPFLRVVARRTNPLQLGAIAALHLCYHVYASATYASVVMASRLGLRHALLPTPEQRQGQNGISQITRAP